jgi:hypothetical protein
MAAYLTSNPFSILFTNSTFGWSGAEKEITEYGGGIMPAMNTAETVPTRPENTAPRKLHGQ